MKRLIFRELWLSKKGVLLNTSIAALIYLFVLLTALSARFGNIARYADAETLGSVRRGLPLFCLVVCVVLMTGCEGMLTLIFADHASGWDRFLRTTGVKPITWIGIKYVTITFWMVLSAAAGLLLTDLVQNICASDIAVQRYILLLCSLFSVFFAYVIPVYLKAGKPEKSSVLVAIPVLIASFGFIILMMILENRYGEEFLAKAILRLSEYAGLVPVIAILSWTISFLVSLKITERSLLK